MGSLEGTIKKISHSSWYIGAQLSVVHIFNISPTPLLCVKLSLFFLSALSFVSMNDYPPPKSLEACEVSQLINIQHVLSSDTDLGSNTMMNQEPQAQVTTF